jgi:hypothetical protein
MRLLLSAFVMVLACRLSIAAEPTSAPPVNCSAWQVNGFFVGMLKTAPMPPAAKGEMWKGLSYNTAEGKLLGYSGHFEGVDPAVLRGELTARLGKPETEDQIVKDGRDPGRYTRWVSEACDTEISLGDLFAPSEHGKTSVVLLSIEKLPVKR